jgi:hypothetical protein
MPSIPWWRAIGVVVQNPQQEDRMHNHEKPVARQRKLHFEDDELWIIFPEEVRERCRELWQEMLASVLQGRERRPDERED